ncbi:IMP dehydrogenase [Marispirochaeta aestuarii]|uniref:Inosine-5'-monophosphate dehydrogenase n=1 Tax=Marispirochaeta aestuarii TaxID=1963862 RepID=A0A1Y1S1D4_9SPIO|nr:IMP dehydrogenase [Marispirochaeta aestuarii]ORC37309.1 IMP dehydrogenase [Marispirochaeta aestuarii]
MEFRESLSYDDVLLIPAYADFLPGEASVRTRLCRDIYLKAPIISAAMDTVTEMEMAIAMALNGGAGVIHRNLSPEDQAAHVGSVKRYLNWVIDNPITVDPDDSIAEVKRKTISNRVSGLPVVDKEGYLKGIITSRDLRFCRDDSRRVKEIMTVDPVVEIGDPTHESAQEKFDTHKIEKLPVVDKKGKLTGLVTVKDIEKHQDYPNAAVDSRGRLIVGAAVSPNDWRVRMPLLQAANVDFVVLDTAHGDSKSVIDAVRDIKANFSPAVIGGNVATPEGTRRLIDAGADAVKVGVGPGSICTTRIVAGIGVPQFTAVLECAREAEKSGIPVVADGGIKFSGDITKAICAGAGTVMIGNLFAGLKEAPGREIIYDGRMFKEYRGMGSLSSIQQGSGDRYQMKEGEAPVPEGIEGKVPYKGELKNFFHQLVTGLKKGMGYCGCRTIDQLRLYRNFVKISSAGLQESHAHDVSITQEAPNYSRN